MPPDRYPVYNVNCGAFSLKKGNLCFQPEDEKPLLQLRFDQDGTRECFFFHEARVRQFDPEGGLGITPKTVTFAKLSSTPTGSKYEETSLEESHHPVASTLTEPQLEDVEWTLTLRSPLPIYRIKRVGDQCTNWTTATLREYNYDLSDLPPDPEVIDYDTENFDPENHPQTRLFKIVEVEGKDPGVDSGIVRWVVMFEHQGSFNIPEVPTPRILWTIPKRYLENRNFEQKEKERLEEMEKKQNERSQEYKSPWGLDTENKEKKKQQQQQQKNKEVEETKNMKETQDEGFPAEDPSSWDQQKSSQSPQGSWGDEPEELEKPAAPTVIRKTKAEEMADLWRGFRQNTKPQVPQVPQVKKQEEPEEVEQTETKKKRKKKKKKSQETQEDQGSEGSDEGQVRQAKEGKEAGKEPKQVEEKEEKKEEKQEESIEERLAKVPLGERWWEPTPAEIEAKKKEEEQRKPGWWGEELWLKRQKEKEEENRKRVEAGGEDRWWDYEERPNPTGWW